MQITCNDVIKSFQKEVLFIKLRHLRMENEKPVPGMARNEGFAIMKGIEPNLEMFLQ